MLAVVLPIRVIKTVSVRLNPVSVENPLSIRITTNVQSHTTNNTNILSAYFLRWARAKSLSCLNASFLICE